MNYDKLNLFSENFDMRYVLNEIEENFEKRKHLLYEINNDILNSQRKRKSIDNYEKNLIEKQIKIMMHTKNNYKKLNNINYVKYYLPYCIQPKTNNTNLCLSKNIYQKNIKQSILRELHTKKKVAKYRIKHFIKKYTGKCKKKSILHKQISELYNEKSKIEIYLKNKKDGQIIFNKVIGNISFFDNKINLLLENVTILDNSNEQQIPWIFIQSHSVVFLKKHN